MDVGPEHQRQQPAYARHRPENHNLIVKNMRLGVRESRYMSLTPNLIIRTGRERYDYLAAWPLRNIWSHLML